MHAWVGHSRCLNIQKEVVLRCRDLYLQYLEITKSDVTAQIKCNNKEEYDLYISLITFYSDFDRVFSFRFSAFWIQYTWYRIIPDHPMKYAFSTAKREESIFNNKNWTYHGIENFVDNLSNILFHILYLTIVIVHADRFKL